MATSQVESVAYEVDTNRISIFGCTGVRLGSCRWAINALGGDGLVEVKPDSIMDRVRYCIDADVRDGNDDKLAQLQLGARQAVVFFLEGQLTREHFDGEITAGIDFVDVPNVEIEGRMLTVRILEDPEYDVATADAEGNIL